MCIVLTILVFALTLYILLGCARTPDESIPVRMPKHPWITLVVLFPTIGPIARIIFSWVKVAEERGSYVESIVWSFREGTTFRCPQRPRSMVPDDDPEFLRDPEQNIRCRKRRPQEHTGAPGASNDGADEGPKAGKMSGIDRSGTDSH